MVRRILLYCVGLLLIGGAALGVLRMWQTKNDSLSASREALADVVKRGPVVQTRETQFRYIVRETGALIYYHLTHGSSDFSDPGLG